MQTVKQICITVIRGGFDFLRALLQKTRYRMLCVSKFISLTLSGKRIK